MIIIGHQILHAFPLVGVDFILFAVRTVAKRPQKLERKTVDLAKGCETCNTDGVKLTETI